MIYNNYCYSQPMNVLATQPKLLKSKNKIFLADGPSFYSHQLTPSHRYVQLGDSTSLVCGTGLDSNPQATITWTAPDGTMIAGNARYDLDNGPDVVALNFSRAVLSDTGVWRCNITMFSEQHIMINGEFSLVASAIIGAPIECTFDLTVICKSMCQLQNFALIYSIGKPATIAIIQNTNPDINV